jgi:tRNA1(Val) A37 N6-methylase TrmN6
VDDVAVGVSDPGELTREAPAPGVVVWQPRRGYRYGVEVYAIAAFAAGEADLSGIRIVDLGCGSGVIGLLLASLGATVTGVERDPAWVAIARRNAAASDRPIDVVNADVRSLDLPRADLVVTNPPWFPAGEPLSPDPLKAASRAMLHGDVTDFVRAGLRIAPRVCVVTRRERERDVAAVGGAHVARRATLGARVVLLEIRPGAGETREEPLDVAAAYRRFGR